MSAIAERSSRRKCEVCHDFDVNYLNEYNYTSASYQEFMGSSQNGCLLCAFVCRVLDDWERRHKNSATEDDRYPRNNPVHHFIAIHRSRSTNSLCLEYGGRPLQQTQLEIYATRNYYPKRPSLPMMSEISGDTSSVLSIDLVKRRLFDCQSAHMACSASPMMQRMPKRLLDVTFQNPKLLEGVTLQEHYACLSHCWGSNQPLKTTVDNIQQHKLGIAWNSIPRTFQDAIQVARKLEIRYVWIDSLCIVQGDARDWAIQSSEMASIYGGALLTIAATCGSDSSHGLFSKAPAECLSIPCELTTPDGCSYSVRVRRLSRLHHLDALGWVEDGVFRSEWPLLTRAWAFQERLLSPRLLQFCEGELVWECRQDSECECGGINGGQFSHDIWKISNPGSYTDIFDFHLKRRFEELEGIQRTWHEIVDAYTRLDMSRQEDIFPALSGIVHKAHQTRETSYLAGLWEDSICKDLVWHTVSYVYSGKHRPREWRAPTWSWASALGRISFEPLDQSDATLIEGKTLPKGTDRFGQLLDGYIILKGCLFNGEVGKRVDNSDWFRLDCLKEDGFSSLNTIVFDIDVDVDHDDHLRFFKIGSVYLDEDDPRKSWVTGHDSNVYCYYFLALAPTETQEPIAIFQRVGLGIISSRVCLALGQNSSSLGLGGQNIVKII